MEKTVGDLDATETLKCKILVLKVLIHCEGCRKKVKKVVQSIEGVYKTEVDPLQHKVVVTGSVEANILIKKLLKNGKQAEIWPESITIPATTTKFDDKIQEKRKPASSSGKSKKYNENKNENPLINEAHKKNPGKKMDEDYNNITAKPSKNKSPVGKMAPGNKCPTNHLHLIEHTENIGEKVAALGGGSGCGSRGREAKKKPNKKAGNGEGHSNNNAPPPSMMAEHFPPSSNVIAPPSDPIQLAYQPMIPAAEYKEVMSYNNSSYSSCNGGSAFYAPPAPQHSHAYSGPPGNGYYYPPPWPDPIRPRFSDHNNDYYYDDDDESGCSIM